MQDRSGIFRVRILAKFDSLEKGLGCGLDNAWKLAAKKITRRALVTDLSHAIWRSTRFYIDRTNSTVDLRSYMILSTAKNARHTVCSLLRVHKITPWQGRVPRCNKRTCIQPWAVATVRSIRAHPNESRGRKASGLPCAAQVAHHDSGVARPESAAPRAAWVHDSPSAEPPMAACCDLLASAGFATDSTVGDCDHERAETPCHPCAAGLSWRAVRRPSWSAPFLGCYGFSTRGACRARFCARWFHI